MNIAEYITDILLNDTALKSHTEKRVFPMVATAGIDVFPFACYSQSSSAARGSKDGEERIVTIQVTICSKSYKESHDVADLVLPAFQKYAAITKANQYGLYNVAFASEDENYDMNADLYMVRTSLTFDYEK